MSNNDTQDDYIPTSPDGDVPPAPEGNTPESDMWAEVSTLLQTLSRQRNRIDRVNQAMVDVLTGARNELAAAQRAHLDGDEVQILQVLQRARDTIFRAFPALSDVASEDETPPVLDQSVRDLAASYWDTVRTRNQTATTGIAGLDNALSGGIESKRLVIVLGAPNTGKTTFVHQLGEHIASGGRPVLYVTSEDTPSALFAKTLARIGQVRYTAVLKGLEQETARINAALAAQQERLSFDRLRYLDASNGITFDLIRERARAHFANYTAEHGGGPGVIVVDYLQRVARAIKSMGGSSQDLREVVTMVAEQLRALACELDCAVIAIASQNRTNYTRGEQGSMASAKESGDVEYTCDVLMALNEDKNRTTSASWLKPIALYIDKNRQGAKDIAIPLIFHADHQQFRPLTSEEQNGAAPAGPPVNGRERRRGER